MQNADAEGWKCEINNEHDRMICDGVWEAVKKADIPLDAKIDTTTWACKKKANGTLQGQVLARGFQQVPHQHYNPMAVAAPVANNTMIHIALVLMLLGGWATHIVDVQGACLKGRFQIGKKIYMKIPEGMEKHYSLNSVLLLKKTIYGLNRAAMQFWRLLLKIMKKMGHERSKADPCMYYSRHK